jgi:hypothetical protein
MENEIKNSEYYIQNKVGRATGFSAPTNYFDTLEAGISAKLSEEKFSKKTAFKVPENYFSTVDNSILSKVSSIKKENKIISFKERFFKIIPFVAAASILLFVGLNSFIFNTNNKLTLDSLSDNDIEYWLDSNTLNNQDIASILQDEILDENEFYFSDIKDKSIEEYINSLDNDTLLNDLN